MREVLDGRPYARRYEPEWPLPTLVLIGARLRHGRRQAGMSQRRLAELSDVSQSEISRVERAVSPGMSIERVARIAFALGPRFPFGCCPHEHRCAWPYNPNAEEAAELIG